jgi:hypothetical protein
MNDELERTIAAYRERIVAEHELPKEDLDELEDHLRSLIEELWPAGSPKRRGGRSFRPIFVERSPDSGSRSPAAAPEWQRRPACPSRGRSAVSAIPEPFSSEHPHEDILEKLVGDPRPVECRRR